MCFRGADLSALVREASVNALRVHLSSGPAHTHTGNSHTPRGHTHMHSGNTHTRDLSLVTEPVKDIRVSRVHFEDAFTKVRPSVSKKVRDIHNFSLIQ